MTCEIHVKYGGLIVSRTFHPGMGQAVANRTILRKKENGDWESWEDVAYRVATGNSLLCPDSKDIPKEFNQLHQHLRNATTVMSGRHLQHGDDTQPTRNMEVFTNCSTACNSFSLFYLLMNGSGVGRCYDDDMMIVNWDNSPALRCVLSEEHPDFDYSAHESVRDALHKYGNDDGVIWFDIEDTREGWAAGLEIWETMTFEKIHKDSLLILNFSKVRCKGSPIKGMQNRPSSGPVPLMNAFLKAATIKDAGLAKWKQAMYVDHYFAECVLVGGARRAARMSTKSWRDKSVIDFITVKRPIEYLGKGIDGVISLRKSLTTKPIGFLWSSNNSVIVDEDFWSFVYAEEGTKEHTHPMASHAHKVFQLITASSYGDGTGEPGIINAHKLNYNREGLSLLGGDYVGSKKYQTREESRFYLDALMRAAKKKQFFMIVNPCGEIQLAVWGAFCVIGDVIPYHANSLDEAEDAFRVTTRALMRVNLMDSIYSKEVERTNRIGVGITGIHEFAWKFFGLGFRSLINVDKSKEFWQTIARFKRAVQDEAKKYAKVLGVTTPHTDTTIKPAGTTSKLFGLTEGWHLPAMTWYLRWVQFSKSDPLVEVYHKSGYPIRELIKYENTIIVGFPTSPVITQLDMGDELVTATEATPEEQYRWIMLGERYWLRGVDEDWQLLKEDTGNQISYTLKYDPNKVDFDSFCDRMKYFQPRVKCCSVMPQEDSSSYEYLPEQAVTKAEYEAIATQIEKTRQKEDVDFTHVDCGRGGCPVDFNKNNAV